MASIQAIKGKKGTTYRVEAMIDGVRKSKTHKTKSQAEKHAARLTLESEAASGLNYRYGHTTLLSDLIEEYSKHYEGKDTSRIQRISFWSDEIGHLPISRITRANVRKTLQNLLKKGLSNATHNRYKAALSSLFRYADEEYGTEHNPCRGIPNKPESQPIDRWATEDELHRLFNAAKISNWQRLYLLILMAVHTGARRGNLITLRWSAIDLKKRIAYLPTSKSKQPIVLPLNIEVIRELEQFREIGNGYLFPHPSDSQTYFKNFDHYYKLACKSAGITTNLRVHDLRHTTGSWLGQAGVVTTEIQQILAHKSITTTQRYVHHNTVGKAKTLCDVFAGIC